ncbi:MAG: hypothetical protein CVU05_13485 [Bacteroidetes bacterium HGW-Bacteroidetes-21]|jgi:streptogramin lyase|nr:MAG: hypothetical protein CVU05_13485 [Bacteroidetes bacterium HGW-Bacteroidetes-21]
MKAILLLVLLLCNSFLIGQTWRQLLFENNLTQGAIVSVASSSNGDVWFASSLLGAYKYNGNSLVNIDVNYGILSNYLKAITIDNAGRVWMGGPAGLTCWNNGVVTNYTAQNGLQAQSIYALASDLSGNIWIGTNQGVIRFNGSTFVQYTVNDGLISNAVKCLYHDGTKLWIGSTTGLCSYNGSVFQQYTIANGLPSNNILCITKDINSNIWIGTNNGVSKYNSAQFANISTVQGLLSDTVNAICSDADGLFWFASPKGLTRFTATDTTFFTNQYYYPGNEVNTMILAGNEIYFGTNKDCVKSKKWVVDNLTQTSLETDSLRFYCNNMGSLANRFCEESPGLEFPKNSGKYSLFGTNFWIAGLDPSSNLHLSASSYFDRGLDFFSGPYLYPPNYNDIYDSLYNRLWKISRAEVETHILFWNQPGYVMPEAIKNWPGLSAPFQDINTNGIYEPENGEYPIIRGDHAVLSIFNDDRYSHGSQGEKFILETSLLCWVYDTSDKALAQTVFAHLNITNKNNINFSDVFLGIQFDSNIGYFNDDFVGCDQTLSCFYSYNGIDNDYFYGQNIPAQGIVFLSSPLYSFLYYKFIGSGPMDEPSSPNDYYYNLRGFWKDGTPFTYGGNGYGGTVSTRYVFDGDPNNGAGWSEVSEANEPGDRVGLGSVGPFDLFPGKSKCIDFAFVTGRDSTGNYLKSITDMKSKMANVISFYNSSSYYCDTIYIENPEELFINTQDVSVCGGSSIELHPMVSGIHQPLTYSWQPSAGLNNSTVANPLAQVNGTTTYYFTVTDANGNTANDSITVFVNPIPTLPVQAIYNICSGAIINIPGYIDYYWNDNICLPFHSFSTSGDYWVMASDSNGCWSDTTDFTVNILSSPLVDLGPNQTLCNNQTQIFSPGTGYSSYLWFDGSTASTYFADGSTFDLGNNIVTVTVTNSQGCSDYDLTVLTVIDCMYTQEEMMDPLLKVYPNPVTHELFIEIDQSMYGDAQIEIFELSGRKVFSAKKYLGTENSIEIPDFCNGIYTLVILTKDAKYYSRFIKSQTIW